MTFGPGGRCGSASGTTRSGSTTRSMAPTRPTTTVCSTFARRTSFCALFAGRCGIGWRVFRRRAYIRQYERDNRSVWLPGARHSTGRTARAPAILCNGTSCRSTSSITTTTTGTTAPPGYATRSIACSAGPSGGRRKRVPTGTTYRFHTQRLTANDPLIFTGLLLALGERVDRPITAWEEMFLPVAMREHLRTVRVAGPGGAAVPLVKSERTIFESTAPAPPDAPPDWLAGYLAIGAPSARGSWASRGERESRERRGPDFWHSAGAGRCWRDWRARARGALGFNRSHHVGVQ